MSYEFVNFRVPVGTKARLQSAAQPHESMTSVLLRAIDLLETTRVNMYVENGDVVTSTTVKPIDVEQLQAQIDALVDRVSAIEAVGTVQSSLPVKARRGGELE